jgi:uncharacterized membrane protein YdbT with pleckstrin-like domain
MAPSPRGGGTETGMAGYEHEEVVPMRRADRAALASIAMQAVGTVTGLIMTAWFSEKPAAMIAVGAISFVILAVSIGVSVWLYMGIRTVARTRHIRLEEDVVG